MSARVGTPRSGKPTRVERNGIAHLHIPVDNRIEAEPFERFHLCVHKRMQAERRIETQCEV